MVVPFAEYRLAAKPEWIDLSMADGDRVVLTERDRVVCARAASELIYVRWTDPNRFPGRWGGVRNHALLCRDGCWQVAHLNHSGILHVNGIELGYDGPRALSDGDVVSPFDGFELRFVIRQDLEVLFAKLPAAFLVPEADPGVFEMPLEDWVLDQTGASLDDARLTCRHLRCRLRASARSTR